MSKEAAETFGGLTKDDVWGEYNDQHEKISAGMIVARGLPESMDAKEVKKIVEKTGYPTKCPIVGDILGYKSVSVVCDKKDQQAVEYWLEYVHGGNCVVGSAELKDDKVMLRSDYMCW